MTGEAFELFGQRIQNGEDLNWETIMNSIPVEFIILFIILSAGVLIIVVLTRILPSNGKSVRKATKARLDFNNLLSELAAGLIAVDGKIAPREVDTAIEIGRELMPDFDETALKTYCYGNKTPRNHKIIARAFETRINHDQKQHVVKYLIAITTADNEIRTSEAELIDEICAIWGIRMNG